ncbi:DUF6252 family protein [Nonlabens sp. SY33080]|uniref:DUF6252 family protein n=1 Tax=unclassified Nonlabens TaxID=2615035 RepID=UPI001428C831|nr:DUF6252 family protein [Nonlabens sp. SY33080]
MLKRTLPFLILILSVVACTTDIEPLDPGLNPNGGNNGGGNLNAVFTAEIDGQFNDYSSTVEAEETEDGFTVGTLGNPTLAIQVFNPAVGSFNVDANNTNTGALILYSSGPNSLYVPMSGTVTITSYDTTNQIANGTFEGVMSDIAGVDPDVIITNGVFQNITYDITTSFDECEALLDGNQFVADVFASAEINNQLSIAFSNSLNEQINIQFPLNITPGTYDIEGLGGTYIGRYTDTNGVDYTSVPMSGELVITSSSNLIFEGTFEFTVAEDGNPANVIVITAGTFIYDYN